ncbi:hypothetical protein [Actinomyces naeslundii]|uniref:hypothetical protein n=1 Tax=Actinomyces naeslundii TaxID=1655 RepID=UPI003B97DB6E
MDGARSQGQRVSIGSSSPAGIARSFFSGTVLTTRLLTCCILIHRARSIACTRQDDSPLLIDQWIDQHPLEEHLVEQLLQVVWCGRVEAVAVFEEVKGLGEALVDFGYVGLVGGQLALDLAQLARELGLFLFEEVKGDGSFVVGMEETAASVLDVGAPGGEGADCFGLVSFYLA